MFPEKRLLTHPARRGPEYARETPRREPTVPWDEEVTRHEYRHESTRLRRNPRRRLARGEASWGGVDSRRGEVLRERDGDDETGPKDTRKSLEVEGRNGDDPTNLRREVRPRERGRVETTDREILERGLGSQSRRR